MNAKKGFTLIELLVVISIIAVLMSILMPALGKVREQAKITICKTNQNSIGKMLMLYGNDNKDSYPMGFDSTGSGLPRTGSWNFAIEPYMEQKGGYNATGVLIDQSGVRACPSAPYKENTIYSLGGDLGNVGWWTFYNADGNNRKIHYGSYGFNRWMYDCPPQWPAGAAANGMQSGGSIAWNWKKTSLIQAPYNVPVLSDSWYSNSMPTDRDRAPAQSGQVYKDESSLDNTKALQGMSMVCIDRHKNLQNNILFADMSIKQVGLKELWTLKWHRKFDTSTSYNRWNTTGEWPDWMK